VRCLLTYVSHQADSVYAYRSFVQSLTTVFDMMLGTCPPHLGAFALLQHFP
jgi:hypothetical protein